MSVESYFEGLAKQHGRTPQAVDAPNQQALDCRWKVLAEPIPDMSSVLDVGCGYGGFGDYLENEKAGCQSEGIDISPTLVAMAKARHIAHLGDVCKIRGHWAWVVGQGLFYKQKDWATCEEILNNMWRLCTKGMAITTIVDGQEDELSIRPTQLLSWGTRLSMRWTLRHDYHSNDVCLYLYK